MKEIVVDRLNFPAPPYILIRAESWSPNWDVWLMVGSKKHRHWIMLNNQWDHQNTGYSWKKHIAERVARGWKRTYYKHGLNLPLVWCKEGDRPFKIEWSKEFIEKTSEDF